MRYLTTKEVGLKWNVNDRRVRVLCEEGRIEGAFKAGKTWMIAEDATKPYDARTSIKKTYHGLTYDFSEIDRLKQEIDQHRPLTAHITRSLREKLIVDWTYHSNAIEGNTLTLTETKVVLEGITIGGKSVIEHLEAINHKHAIEYIESIIHQEIDITPKVLQTIHGLILKDIDVDNAGLYRKANVIISGATHIPPNHLIVPDFMQKMFAEYSQEWRQYHPVIQAFLLHGEFVKIHPFIDGNGRTARLLLNLVLMKHGYPPVVITKHSRLDYYDALDTAHTTLDYSEFIKLVSNFLVESELLWLQIIG